MSSLDVEASFLNTVEAGKLEYDRPLIPKQKQEGELV